MLNHWQSQKNKIWYWFIWLNWVLSAMNWWCNEEIVWSNITINSDCILKLIIKSSSLSRIWSACVSLRDRLMCCLLLLPLSPLCRLLLQILLLITGGVHVGGGRIWRLRGRQRGRPPLIFPDLHQKLDFLKQFLVIVRIEATTELEESLGFFFIQISQKLVHESFVVNLFHFQIGWLIMQFRSFVRFIYQTLQELLGFLMRWIFSYV
jgi:hypothetical protein